MANNFRSSIAFVCNRIQIQYIGWFVVIVLNIYLFLRVINFKLVVAVFNISLSLLQVTFIKVEFLVLERGFADVVFGLGGFIFITLNLEQ